MQGDEGRNDVSAANAAGIPDCFALLAMTRDAVIARRSRRNPERRAPPTRGAMQGDEGRHDVSAANAAGIPDCFALLAMTGGGVIARRSRSNPEARALAQYVVI